MKKLLQTLAHAAGYELRRAVPSEKTAVETKPKKAKSSSSSSPVDPRPALLAKYGVERLAPSSYTEYQSDCPPLTAAPVVLPSNLTLHAHADLSAFATNKSLRTYFRTEPVGDTYSLTDHYPGSHYFSRQCMLYASYRRSLGDGLLTGASLLDVGCSSGYYSFYASRLQAAQVTGIDARPEHEEQFRVLHELFKAPSSCAYRHVDMEFGLEQMTESYDVVLAQGVMYHVYDHPRFIKNLYRLTNRMLVLEGGCSGRSDLLCYPDIEQTGNPRASIHGPVLYPSVAWTIELLRWAGFRELIYVDLPDGIEDGWGFNQLRRVMLLALK